jgi:uncharacterized protein YbjQ (UPF0145 family)
MVGRVPTNVTTTSTIDGWSIEAYLGPVAVHRVAGTGLLSDTLAGFSDLFGGRSESYQHQLESLYAEAVTELLRAAELRGGNWILGLQADFDEISGKNKQMFMLVVIGTVVRARRDSALTVTAEGDEPPAVSGYELAAVLREDHVLRRLAAHENITADDWDFLAERRVSGAILRAVELILPPGPQGREAAEETRRGDRRPLVTFERYRRMP